MHFFLRLQAKQIRKNSRTEKTPGEKFRLQFSARFKTHDIIQNYLNIITY